MAGKQGGRDIYFEFVPVGSVVKVTAIDSETGLEVSILGPVRAARSDLQQVALAKLKAQLARRSAR